MSKSLGHDKVRVSLDLTKEEHKELKRKLIDEEKTIMQFLQELVREYIKWKLIAAARFILISGLPSPSKPELIPFLLNIQRL